MRLFVALDLSAAAREEVRARFPRLVPDARLVNPLLTHVTLKFLGDVSEAKVHKVVAALQLVPFSSFPLQTTKFGSFAHSFWLGVKLTKQLAQLQLEVVRAVREFTTHDPRPFKPHVTLARFDELSEEAAEVLRESFGERLETRWRVESFTLYRSVLDHDGLAYHVVASFPLVSRVKE